MIWSMENNPDIVISTRVRLARNLDGIPFPNRLSNKIETINSIKQAVFQSNSTISADFEDVGLSNMSETEKLKLSERHLISPQMLSGTDKECLINKDKTVSIMIMEEDHIREQVILGGYKPDEAYELCDKIDDVLSESLKFAYDEKFGYLTSCPTNAGTGLRVSVMLHLPALSIMGKIGRIVSSAANLGITVRGYNGEGTEAEGCFYQISNQLTMGISEREIIDRVKSVTDQIIAFEKESRQLLLKDKKDALEDKLWRSYGILKYARTLTSKEAISLLSDVLMGINMGMITNEIKMPIMELIVLVQPGGLGGTDLAPGQRDLKRAEFVRDNL